MIPSLIPHPPPISRHPSRGFKTLHERLISPPTHPACVYVSGIAVSRPDLTPPPPTPACVSDSGIAVSSVMLITTHFVVLFFIVDWELSSFIVVPFYLLFALIEGGENATRCETRAFI